MFTARNPAFGRLLQLLREGVDRRRREPRGRRQRGRAVRKLTGPGTPGFHRVTWDLQREPRERLARSEWGDQPEFVAPGTYTVELTYGKLPKQKQTVIVRHAPGTADPSP